MDINDIPADELADLKRQLATEAGRKGGQSKSEKKRLAGQRNIAKASKRLAEVRAAKRVLENKPTKGQPATAGNMTETS